MIRQDGYCRTRRIVVSGWLCRDQHQLPLLPRLCESAMGAIYRSSGWTAYRFELSDPFVSPPHARLTWEEFKCEVRQLLFIQASGGPVVDLQETGTNVVRCPDAHALGPGQDHLNPRHRGSVPDDRLRVIGEHCEACRHSALLSL